MPKISDAFAQRFRELLKEIPDDFTLEQWQHAYRQAIFSDGHADPRAVRGRWAIAQNAPQRHANVAQLERMRPLRQWAEAA